MPLRESKMLSGITSIIENIKTNEHSWCPVMPCVPEVLPCVPSTILWGKYYSLIRLTYKKPENREAEYLTQSHTARKQDSKMKPTNSGLCFQSFLWSSLPVEDLLLNKHWLRNSIFQKNLKTYNAKARCAVQWQNDCLDARGAEVDPQYHINKQKPRSV